MNVTALDFVHIMCKCCNECYNFGMLVHTMCSYTERYNFGYLLTCVNIALNVTSLDICSFNV